MTPRSAGRTAPCTTADARARLRQARAYLSVAEGAQDDEDLDGWPDVAAGCAVLSGIAASDAICCATVGMRPRGQDHRLAVDALHTAIPDGASVSGWLRKLLDLKDASHYGVTFVSPAKARDAVKQARRLVGRADEALAP